MDWNIPHNANDIREDSYCRVILLLLLLDIAILRINFAINLENEIAWAVYIAFYCGVDDRILA